MLCWYEQIMSPSELADKYPTIYVIKCASIDLSQHRSHQLTEDPSSLLSLFFVFSIVS